MTRRIHTLAALLVLPLLLTGVPAGAQDSGYGAVIAAQLSQAMTLEREAGKAAEGTAMTVELELGASGRIVASTIVAIEGAPDEATADAVFDALASALAHHQSDPFSGLPPEDHAAWSHLRLTFTLGLHVGGYQP